VSFNYMNENSENIFIWAPTADEAWNHFSPRHDIDVSAIEAEGAVVGGVASHASNKAALNFNDGGAAGTGTTNLATDLGDSDGFTDVTPQSFTMSTSASDINPDDWINGDYDESGTLTPVAVSMHLSYVFGVPGGVA
jgi:hypothetical protein